MPMRTAARAEPGFVEEDGEAGAGRDHRGDEQQGDRGAEAIAGEEGGEQQDHDHARSAPRPGPMVKMALLTTRMRRSSMRTSRISRSCSSPAAVEDARLELARAVDDPRQAAGADVEEGAEPGEQEHRRDRKLDDLREMGQSGEGGRSEGW